MARLFVASPGGENERSALGCGVRAEMIWIIMALKIVWQLW